jgi:hypothetical protein
MEEMTTMEFFKKKDYEERHRKEMQMIAEWDEVSALDKAKRTGMKIGLKQAAKGMLAQGASMEFTINATGLTEEEILT